jgi:Na+-transporting methylmalonyl-CoA/oxaloacetate decarboxylase gamma subunit
MKKDRYLIPGIILGITAFVFAFLLILFTILKYMNIL